MKVQSEEVWRASPGEALSRPEEFLQSLLDWKGAPQDFWGFLLHAQCRLSGAVAAAVFRAGAEGLAVAGVYPGREAQAEARDWARFAPLAVEAQELGRTVTKPLAAQDDLYGQAPKRFMAVVPLPSPDAATRLAGAYLFPAGELSGLDRAIERLEWTAGLLRVVGIGSELERRASSLRRLSTAIETLGAINENHKFAASAMGLCNEVASRWGCERAGLGVLRGRYVRLRALSHTEKFSRKMEIIQEIETVMEECLDQDVEVLVPALPQSTYGCREATRFAGKHGPACVLSLPLRSEGKVAGVLTIERPVDKPLTTEDVETLRLTCDLCSPRLLSLEKHDRWVGAKLVSALRAGAAGVVGSAHTGLKLIVMGVIAFVLYAVLAKGDYQAEASFFLESDQRRVVPAPFDGELESVAVTPGDQVAAGAELAQLRTSELRLQLAEANAAWAGYLKQASAARGVGKIPEAQAFEAEADGAKSQVDLLDYRLQHARIASPIDGTVITGDLKKMVGARVQPGQVLFEVAPLETMRAELLVPEDQIADVREQQEGTLASVSKPEEKASFVVERIEPVAEIVGQKNVFRVRARLPKVYPWMHMGLEGVAKIDIDRRSYAWIWTRPAVNWIRMKLWI
jgi:multidrug resistance efflux pump